MSKKSKPELEYLQLGTQLIKGEIQATHLLEIIKKKSELIEVIGANLKLYNMNRPLKGKDKEKDSD